MVQKIIKNKGGLHNRITQKIRLLPFNLHETELLLKSKKLHYSRYDILQLYMALGGIPYYLEKLIIGESVIQALDRICFEIDGFLADEFDLVFASLYNNSERHVSIIKALATARSGLTRNEIAQKSNLPTGGTFSNTVQELIESGFVTKYPPFEKKSKESIYRLTDEYSMFYLKFIEANKSGGKGTWTKLARGRSYSSWSGFTFETVCLKHIAQIKEGLGIANVFSKNASWKEKNAVQGTQVDLLIDRDDNVVNLCEMKFQLTLLPLQKSMQGNSEARSMFLKTPLNQGKRCSLQCLQPMV
jgi:hypothetical protein